MQDVAWIKGGTYEGREIVWSWEECAIFLLNDVGPKLPLDDIDPEVARDLREIIARVDGLNAYFSTKPIAKTRVHKSVYERTWVDCEALLETDAWSEVIAVAARCHERMKTTTWWDVESMPEGG